jgi:tRNA pseudouridine55 synthase
MQNITALKGILCMNKPEGFTSFDVVAKLRGILKTKSIGHTGTLDPMATGVLICLIGKAAKACDLLPDNDKEYRAKFKLGIVTNTQDITGEILETKDVAIARNDIEKLLPQFTGEIKQIPPMFSAVKIGGQKLCNLARKGVEVEREPRLVTVYSATLTGFEKDEGELIIKCGKGTYIRTIIHDLGQKLGCGAVMTSLARTQSNGFTLDNCMSFVDVENCVRNDTIAERLVSVESVFNHLPEIRLNDTETKKYKNGMAFGTSVLGKVKVYGNDGDFLGLGTGENGVLKVFKNF